LSGSTALADCYQLSFLRASTGAAHCEVVWHRLKMADSSAEPLRTLLEQGSLFDILRVGQVNAELQCLTLHPFQLHQKSYNNTTHTSVCQGAGCTHMAASPSLEYLQDIGFMLQKIESRHLTTTMCFFWISLSLCSMLACTNGLVVVQPVLHCFPPLCQRL
jgi:hypothetical protein